MDSSFRKVIIAGVIVMTIVGLGGLGYHWLGGQIWSLADSAYFALITVSTVGYGEMHNLNDVPGARLLTVALILGGSAALVYFQSTITAAIVEGRLGKAFRSKRMQNKIEKLSGHIVVAGVGSTGQHVVRELIATKRPFVVVDTDLERLESLNLELAGGNMLFVNADATLDHTLIEAGIKRAAGVIAALTSDRENLFVTLSARSLNPRARIVAKVVKEEAEKKMRIAGADATVSPNIIGGLRMASELIRPEVVQFLDEMMRDKDKNLRIEEVTIQESSNLVGMSLREAPIRKHVNVLVIAARDASGRAIYNPGPDFILDAGVVLIFIAEAKGVRILKELVERETTRR